MWTSAGQAWLATLVGAEALVIVVADGQGAEARQEGEVRVDGGAVEITATFGENDANFEWSERRIEVDGTVIESDDADQGRKVQGMIWTVTVTLDFVE